MTIYNDKEIQCFLGGGLMMEYKRAVRQEVF